MWVRGEAGGRAPPLTFCAIARRSWERREPECTERLVWTKSIIDHRLGGRVQNHDVTFNSEVGRGTFRLRATDTIALLCHCWLSHELVTASTVAIFIAGDETYWKWLGIRA